MAVAGSNDSNANIGSEAKLQSLAQSGGQFEGHLANHPGPARLQLHSALDTGNVSACNAGSCEALRRELLLHVAPDTGSFGTCQAASATKSFAGSNYT